METMTAVRVHTHGDPKVVKYEQAPRSRPGPGEVLTRVRAAGRQTVELLLAMLPEFELAVVLGTGLAVGAAWNRLGIWPATAFVALGTGLAVVLEALAMLSSRVLPPSSGAERSEREALRNASYGQGLLGPSPRLVWRRIRENVVLHLVIIALMSGFTRIVLVMLAWSRVL